VGWLPCFGAWLFAGVASRRRVHARRTLLKVPHKNVMCFAFSLIFSIFSAKNYTFPIREKKQQTAKGLLLKIGVFPISFMGCIYD
jgi:hypothetical protein